MIRSLSGAANENEYAGTIVWQLWHKDIIYDVLTRYDFTYNASGTVAFLEQVDYANARVRLCVPLHHDAHKLAERGHRAPNLPALHQSHHRPPLPVRRRAAAL